MILCDFLVIGSGVAGLTFALRCAEHGRVVVVCKRCALETSTRYAQGGIAAVSSPDDSFEQHISDTLIAGAGLCDRKIVEGVVQEGPDCVRDLIEQGTKFDKCADSNAYSLGREGGHSERRILHAGDMTGLRIQEALLAQAKAHPNIEIHEDRIAIDLIRVPHSSPDAHIAGAYVLEQDEEHIMPYVARATLVATGGAGKVYLVTSNPDIATGDGIAMAYRAGAPVANMEFYQFHPTCLYHPYAKSFLITEAMRGEGAKLLTAAGQPFMQKYHPDGELAPRDIVARAIDNEMKASGDRHVLLDISHKSRDFLQQRFPSIFDKTQEYGIDISTSPIPVVPAAHYCCGGVLSDEHGRTRLPRLYVAGEVACTGLHGANRLASNSLLEAVVFARRAADDAIKNWRHTKAPHPVSDWDYVDSVQSPEKVIVSHLWEELRLTMWNLVGIMRNTRRLDLAKRRIAMVRAEVRDYYWRYRVTRDLVELRNISKVAELIVRSALQRKESRGLHFTTDYPQKDDSNCLRPTVLVRSEEKVLASKR